MKLRLNKPFGLLFAAATALSLTSCAPVAETPQETALPTIVATTNVWADVAQQVAGDNFEVIALISDPAQDPHSYEASARDQLAVKEADMFIMNGGGYDDFALNLASAAGVTPFNVFEIHEGEHSDEAHSEEAHTEEAHSEDEHTEEAHTEDEHNHSHDGSDHIWYDFHVAEHIAGIFATEFAELQPENAAEFESNADAFRTDISELEERRDALVAEIAYFEAHPLATLLFNDMGFENLTPEGFAESEEAEIEPSASTLKAAQDLIKSGTLAFLAVNRQVTSPTLDSLRLLAEENSVPVLEFDELLPAATSYQQWAAGVIDQLEAVIR